MNNKEIYNREYNYGYYHLKSLDADEKADHLVDMEIGKKQLDTNIEYKNEVKCTAAELRIFDFLHGNCLGGGIVSPRVVAYFQKHYPQDVAFSKVSIKTSTEDVNEYQMIHYTNITNISYDDNQSYYIRNPQHSYLYNPAFNEGAIPKGRILVHKGTFRALINEGDALKLKEQGFIGLGLAEVKMSKHENK